MQEAQRKEDNRESFLWTREPLSVILRKTTLLLLNVSVKVKDLFNQGKAYPWRKPEGCPECKGRRLWGHGFTLRCFIGFLQKIWVKKYRCPDCRSVHTIRPDAYWKRFQYSSFVIVRCLLTKIEHGRRRKSVSRRSQQYWYKGLKRQASRHINVKTPVLKHLRRLLQRKIIPVSHSIDCEILRL